MERNESPIITSRCDQDLYKFSMAQAIYHNYTNVQVRYEFTCRTEGVDLAQYLPLIRAEIEAMRGLSFTSDEINGMKNRKGLSFLKDDFYQYLTNSTLNPDYITLYESEERGGISIIIQGPWVDTIWFEIPILAIISEIYFFDQLYRKGKSEYEAIYEGIKKLENKISSACEKYGLEQFPWFTDFGTRRRASKAIHAAIVSFLSGKKSEYFIGTSNVALGLENGVNIVGTMAHEWIMAHSAFTRFDLSQKMALDVWQKEYRDQLGTALTDTYTTDFFLKDFDSLLAKSFSGVRQDSGDPIEIGYKLIRHYESLNIDPMTKQIIFSNGLSFDKIAELYKEFRGKIQIGFGIGTGLTFDIFDIMPLNIVIKLSYVMSGNEVWYPMIKLSDDFGKTMCREKEYAEFVRKIVDKRIGR